MKPLHSLAKAVALATLLSAASLHAYAADIPLAGSVEADELVTKVLSVDAAKHRVVLEGAQGQPVHVQLSDQAKDLGHLKVGDQVNVRVTHAVVAVLDTDVEKGLPNSAERTGVVRATKDNPNPGGEAYRQVQVQLKITAIDLKKNQLTFQGPAGNKKVLDVEKPEVQARLKDLKVGQSVVVTYTDVLQVTTQHEG
ncbi:hypothetical protein ACTJKT_21255 [Pseudomonas sp. 22526]|uniref:DUF5666 domain-containing protein n=1 Tax=Pseudomonas chlororaphis TaxID=587753 RepID=A0AAX3G349_9PSED|nr:hypothetical protein [Pseudomonas chlororaphis]AZC36606.1 hypothetical protein C4K37_2219 [Pseudomonas chlororaphis subsp. piscium]AZC43151.1 hypothetical protein C4K36_2226 [Pseudomonas chlororaphis subsp. piscium]AZC62637.1 hypothetical protein C4K33_2145 [Pseudomonas chlororaphis subsp. piscium]AZC68869.1 hypothetical protein C4K32_2207 [Pseudomonas chlororaphis subsp. piscium]AZC81323.1 hypothetical protein C4K30_2209 [Pseudomonas chlororaphis subsp. piscium]